MSQQDTIKVEPNSGNLIVPAWIAAFALIIFALGFVISVFFLEQETMFFDMKFGPANLSFIEKQTGDNPKSQSVKVNEKGILPTWANVTDTRKQFNMYCDYKVVFMDSSLNPRQAYLATTIQKTSIEWHLQDTFYQVHHKEKGTAINKGASKRADSDIKVFELCNFKSLT